jgi:DNA excision repair protein ERCC-4
MTSPSRRRGKGEGVASTAGAAPSSLLPCVVIDTREQLPYSFPQEQFRTVIRTLQQGDYSLEGFEDRISIERKSLDDFVSSVILDRFWNELERLRSYERALIVVEAGRPDVTARKYKSNVDPRAIFGAEAAIFADYGIAVHWSGDRPHSVDFVRRFFLRYWKNVQNSEAKK